MDANRDRNPIEVKNTQEELERGNPIFEQKPDLGSEERAADVTEANHEIEMQHGEDVTDGDTETRLEQISGHSVDEHMPAGSESPEDKVQDIINSGIIWM